MVSEQLRLRQVRRVQVLRSMGQEVEACVITTLKSDPAHTSRSIVRTSHEKDSVNAQKPVGLKHLPSLVQEDFRLLRGGAAARTLGGLSAEEDLALGEEEANECGERRDTGCRPEQAAPARRGFGDKGEVDDRREQVPDGISLLKNTGREATDFDGQILEGGRGGKAPDTAHRDTEERTDGEEGVESFDESGAKFEDRDHEQVDDERPFAAKAVGDDTKDDLWQAKRE